MCKRVLLVFAHPAFESSRVNRALLNTAAACEHVHVHDLYAHYPEQMIDTKHEQALVDQHDIVVFQHPMFWYSCPALLKNWLDSVLSYGWAFGDNAGKLQGKSWVHAISTGGSDSVYQRRGYNQFSLAEFLRPFEQTARLCAMQYLQPFLTQAVDTLSDEYLQEKAQEYAGWLQKLTNGELPPEVDSLQSEQAEYLAPQIEKGIA
ncbi:NAD(P)H-dependent oxidoreductase [Methylobacillus caricis]|uniref:NAD(P)H-dependent oxidoreductase n=1 Tax=Methylobacillus caricis TaxID=1971611 RepID=UPI001CFF791A|nr:NAD(P)H-dependent oxidoreductase [Methylobacillus caricis]MCB5188686.1 NAD(P)H-dependent oxidoreductase [Methylobacillus caricis]